MYTLKHEQKGEERRATIPNKMSFPVKYSTRQSHFYSPQRQLVFIIMHLMKHNHYYKFRLFFGFIVIKKVSRELETR